MPKTNETIEAMVRDFTQVQPRSKSEVRERILKILAIKDAACEERVREAVQTREKWIASHLQMLYDNHVTTPELKKKWFVLCVMNLAEIMANNTPPLPDQLTDKE